MRGRKDYKGNSNFALNRFVKTPWRKRNEFTIMQTLNTILKSMTVMHEIYSYYV